MDVISLVVQTLSKIVYWCVTSGVNGEMHGCDFNIGVYVVHVVFLFRIISEGAIFLQTE